MYRVTVRILATPEDFWASVDFVDSSGKTHRREVRQDRAAPMRSNMLQALISAVGILTKPCGLTVIAQAMFGKVPEETEAAVQYRIEYEPNYSRSRAGEKKAEAWRVCPRFQADLRLYGLKGLVKNLTKGKLCRYRTYSYDAIWQYILRRKPEGRKSLAGAFVRCDVTPRRQERALIYKGATPGKFAEYMKRLAEKVRREYAEPYIFLSAWNEWGEGMYLEPDEKDGYRYLEGVRDAVQGRNTVQDSQEAAPHPGQDPLEKPAKGL